MRLPDHFVERLRAHQIGERRCRLPGFEQISHLNRHSPQRRKERKGNPDNKKKRFMSFENWIADTRDKSGFRTLQVFCRLFLLLFFAFFAPLR